MFLVAGWIATAALAAMMFARYFRLYKAIVVPGGPSRNDRRRERLLGMVQDIFLHQRLRRFTLSGLLHGLIFFGFLFLITAALQSIFGALFPVFDEAVSSVSLSWFGALQEFAAISVLAGVGLAAWHRYVMKPRRFRGSNGRDALLIYGFVLAIILSMMAELAALRVLHGLPFSISHPISSLLALLFPLSPPYDQIVLEAARWLHIFAILSFLVYIPGSKHRHILLAGPNIFYRSLKPKGWLPEPNQRILKDEAEDKIDLSWKDKLDVLACTECGRCQAVCPAAASGSDLSPKLLIMTLRDQSLGEGEVRYEAGVSESALWACTTCRACVDECPIHIEHVSKIVDLRRMLVENAAVEPKLAAAFTNLQKTGNSFGKPGKSRARWTKDLAFRIPDARDQPVDWLWFVGDVAAFDPRALETTRRLAELFHRAGLNYGILYDGESNSGNDVRRAGEEGSFRALASNNIAALSEAQFSRIVTSDPHSLNALRNEYPSLGGNFEVHHHASVLLAAVKDGRLASPKNADKTKVTYHDPCYLGRYNGDYDAPRALITAAGYDLLEMPRNRENSFCCGAGGGRFWMDDSDFSERPSENRIKEAIALGEIQRFVVSCPKDKVMYTAAVNNLGLADQIKVMDVVDLMFEEIA